MPEHIKILYFLTLLTLTGAIQGVGYGLWTGNPDYGIFAVAMMAQSAIFAHHLRKEQKEEAQHNLMVRYFQNQILSQDQSPVEK